jgi:SAM-dependent methyltransferase
MESDIATATAPLVVERDALPFILLQRTAYLSHPRHPVYRLLKGLRMAPSFDAMVRFESRHRAAAIQQAFDADMRSEYETIRDFLPQRPSAILDIGCGIAGIDVFLHRHYGRPTDIDFHLLDKSHVEESVFYHFRDRAAFYNSLDHAKRFLVDNGVSAERILAHEVQDDGRIPGDGAFDLVISLISWGFHYPVGVYIEQVAERLRPGGRLILDVRKNTDGMETLARHLPNISVILDTPKYARVLAIK